MPESMINLIEIDNIKSILKNKEEVCVFIGAGASIMPPTSLPSFQELNTALLSNLCQSVSESRSVQTHLKSIHTKPEQLLQIIWDYTNGAFNPIQCFQYASPNKNHDLIASLAAQGVHCIVTPNFDPCLEKALNARKIPFEFYNQTPSTEADAAHLFHSIKSETTVIWKPHGDCRDPQTLCYTRTKVSKLSNSKYLRAIFSYIIENYHVLFLGYSGYDDDFFPILCDTFPHSKKQFIWNAYQFPEENAPCLWLKKLSPDNFHLWVGDMTELLGALSEKYEPAVYSQISLNWQKYLSQQFFEITKSTKMAMLAKYFHDFGFIKQAQTIWAEGLALPEKYITQEDKLRFQMNLGIISPESAFQTALQQKYYYIAEIALRNLISDSIYNGDLSGSAYYLDQYDHQCKSGSSLYFNRGQYYFYLYSYKLDALNINPLHLKTDFETAYQALSAEGEITVALNLITKHYGAITARNQGNADILEESISKLNQLVPYGDYCSIAGAYYYLANLAFTLDKKEIALIYHHKCVEAMELCCARGVYQDEQYHELWSMIHHQGALLASDRQTALQREMSALSEAEKLQNQGKAAYHKGFIYNSLCSIYMWSNYNLAVKYGELALKFGQQTHSLQNIARSYTYLAVADAQHGLRQNALHKFKKAYMLHQEILEGLDYFYSVLEECGIAVSELEGV